MKKIIKLTEGNLSILFKKIITEKKLHEIAGISYAARVYTDIIYDKIKNNNSNSEIEIKTKDYPEEYKKFPIEVIHVSRGQYTEYDEHKSTLSDIYITIGNFDNENYFKSAINHEMKHAYEDFLNKKFSGKGLKDKKSIKNLFTNDFYDILKNQKKYSQTVFLIFYFYYLFSKVEQSAALENLYDNFDLPFKSLFSWFKYFDWNSKIPEDEWKKLKQMNIPLISRFETSEEFVKASEKALKKMFTEYSKKINKMKYAHGLIIKAPNSNLYAEKNLLGGKYLSYSIFNLPKGSPVGELIYYDKEKNIYEVSNLRTWGKIVGNTPEEVLAKVESFLKEINYLP